MRFEMTSVIAVRRFWWVDEPSREMLVRIGKPEAAPEGTGEFYCPIQTVGFGNDEFIQPIFGSDGFQALELALRFVGYRMADIDGKSGGRLRWEYGTDGRIPKDWAQGEQRS